MKIKDGVILAGLQLEMRPALIIADRVWKTNGKELVITSALDGLHSAGSYHYYGFAIDGRTRYFDELTKRKVFKDLITELRAVSPHFDVLLHKTHMHIEWDVRKAIKAGDYRQVVTWV